VFPQAAFFHITRFDFQVVKEEGGLKIGEKTLPSALLPTFPTERPTPDPPCPDRPVDII
jgi:hypothetical protein